MITCPTCKAQVPDDYTAYDPPPCDREPDCGGCDLLTLIWQRGEYDRALEIVRRYETPQRR